MIEEEPQKLHSCTLLGLPAMAKAHMMELVGDGKPRLTNVVLHPRLMVD